MFARRSPSIPDARDSEATGAHRKSASHRGHPRSRSPSVRRAWRDLPPRSTLTKHSRRPRTGRHDMVNTAAWLTWGIGNAPAAANRRGSAMGIGTVRAFVPSAGHLHNYADPRCLPPFGTPPRYPNRGRNRAASLGVRVDVAWSRML